VLIKTKAVGNYDSFSGVLASQRLIFAQMTGEMLMDAVNQAREKAKAVYSKFHRAGVKSTDTF